MRDGTKGWAGVLLACGAVAGVAGTTAAATITTTAGRAAIVFSGVRSGTLVVKPPPNSACYVQRSHHTFTVTLEGRVHHVPVLLSVTVGPYSHPHTYRIRPVSAANGIPVEVSIEGGGPTSGSGSPSRSPAQWR